MRTITIVLIFVAIYLLELGFIARAIIEVLRES